MDLKELVYKNRTVRRYDQSKEIPMKDLEEMVDLARVSSCAGNNQALKYVIVNHPDMCRVVFDHLKWAASLPDWDGPKQGERPTAYIIAFHDESISKNILWDLGLAVQNLTLGATEKGYAGCQFASVNRPSLKQALGIEDENLKLLMVLALGVPLEEVILTDIPDSGETVYWRDQNQVHFVPKRKLEEIVLKKI